MDAPEDNKDVKLYRASGDLLSEILAKLPQLVRHSTPLRRGQIRRWVIWAKVDEIIQRLDRFQEWPQLLDPHLSTFIQVLADAFLSYVTTSAECYADMPSITQPYIIPLPRAISKLLYVFCKVRGQKIIVRLLNNEPRYLEPLLTFMARWSSSGQPETPGDHLQMVWEERYVLLLWISHVTLTPFDLSSVSSVKIDVTADVPGTLTKDLPHVAASLLTIAIRNLFVPSKEREAASTLFVRLALRSDLQAQQLLGRCIRFTAEALERREINSTVTAYHHVGLLSLLFGILNTGSNEDVAPFVRSIFAVCQRLAAGSAEHEITVRMSAPVRKLLIKTMRSAIIHTISLESKASPYFATDDLDAMLEEAIQYLLEALSDKDTPVRMAASKNLAMIVLKLNDEMSGEVVQAVLDSLNENILLEDLETGAVVGTTTIFMSQRTSYRRNISAVDPLRWQGLMLTLGHLLFRRSPPPHQLPSIIEALISGLHFEQRSNVGTSVGVGVRDAACFGVWCLARKYSTNELMAVDVSEIRDSATQVLATARPITVLQLMAMELVVSACTDPSGNIRRGSSAALQELIGRHPDTISAGIPLIQAVDYHAVARRSSALCEVAIEAAKLSPEYHMALLNALLDWRGAKSADSESRRYAASAVGTLITSISHSRIEGLCTTIMNRTIKLRPSNTGITAEIRHGYVLVLSSILSTLGEMHPNSESISTETLRRIWSSLGQLIGSSTGRVTRDLEPVLEAVSSLIQSLANLRNDVKPDAASLANAVEIAERCTVASDKDQLVDTASQAAVALLQIFSPTDRDNLVRKWTNVGDRKRSDYMSRGRITTLGRLFSTLPQNGHNTDLKLLIFSYMKDLTAGAWAIETRVSAMTSLTTIIPSLETTPDLLRELMPVIIAGLTDYTLDQRGDVGSTLRLQSIDAVSQLQSSRPPSSGNLVWMRPLIAEVAKQAGEKLSKIRLRAWTCLVQYWDSDPAFPPQQQQVSHVADVSSREYYDALLILMEVPWLRNHLIVGLVSSAAAGTEDIGRASCEALVSYLLDLSESKRYEASCAIFFMLLHHLSACAVTDDRNIIPSLEMLALLLEHGLLTADSRQPVQIAVPEIWSVMERLHSPTASIQRLETIVKLYSALCTSSMQKTRAMDKLTRLLLHRYPKIRSASADTLYLHTRSELLVPYDWAAPIAKLKPTVLQLRKELDVTASATAGTK